MSLNTTSIQTESLLFVNDSVEPSINILNNLEQMQSNYEYIAFRFNVEYH